MDATTQFDLADEQEIALAYTYAADRGALSSVFALDQRLGRIVSGTSEPMLGQMRLAWWRDILKADPSTRPSGDAVLDAIGQNWAGREGPLTDMVDAWEVMVASEAIGRAQIEQVACGRAASLVAALGNPDGAVEGMLVAAKRYFLADLAARLSQAEEREMALTLGSELPALSQRLPKRARGLAVLDALAARALAKGGRPMMEGRGASLIAMKTAILGR